MFNIKTVDRMMYEVPLYDQARRFKARNILYPFAYRDSEDAPPPIQ